MKKNFPNKIAIIAAVIFHVMILFGYFNIRAVGSTSLMSGSFGGVLIGVINGFIFMMAGLLGSAVVAIQLWMYCTQKERSIAVMVDAIMNTIIGVLGGIIIISISNVNLFLINTLMITTFIALVVNIVLLLCLQGTVHIAFVDPYLPVNQDTIETGNAGQVQTGTVPSIDGQQIKGFFTSKVGKGIIGAIVACVLVFAGYKVWDTFFNKTSIDLFQDISVTFDGDNGSGYSDVEPGDIDFDINNTKIERFLDNVYYSVENDGDLSNGDTVKVTAEYSKETAKKLNLDIKQETMEVTVSGLIEQYKSASEIDKALYEEAKTTVLNKAKEKSTGSTNTFYKAYFAVNEDTDKYSYYDNELVFVFKNEYKNYSGESKVKYIYYNVEFDSSFTADSIYLYSSNLYKVDSFDYVDNEADVLKALEEEYSSDDYYKLEEMK